MPSAPELKPGQEIRLRIDSIDDLTLELACRYLETIVPEAVALEDPSDGVLEAID